MSYEILFNAIRNVVAIDRSNSDCSQGLKVGEALHFSETYGNWILRLNGFSWQEPDGRWTDGTAAVIDLKLAVESLGTGRLRLHLMPFVTETKGQTLRLRCGKAQEQVVEFLPGAGAWTTVELPLAGVRAGGYVRIDLAVGHTFVPYELGLNADTRALGVKIRQIELLSDIETDSACEQTSESTALPSAVPEHLAPFALGSVIDLAAPEAEQTVRLAGFSGIERDGRWTDGAAATVAMRLGTHTNNARLRLHFTPFVTSRTGQSIRLRCADGPELVRSYLPGPWCETMLDVPLNAVQGDDDVLLSIKIDTPNSPAARGLGDNRRQFGIKLHRLELVAGLSRLRSTARRAPRSLLNHLRRVGFKLRNKLIAPIVQSLAELENAMTRDSVAQGRRLGDQLNALRSKIAQLTTKQAVQLDAIVRAIEALPTRVEVEATGTRVVMLEQVFARIEQMVVGLHEKTDVLGRIEPMVIRLHQKTDVVANRFLLAVDDHTVLVRSFVGFLYCSRTDHAVLVGLAEGGEFEPGLRRVLERVLGPGMTFLDVGAHIGLHTLAAARRVGSGGHVFSLEPTPETYDLLCRTLWLNGLDNRVTVWRAAAGRDDTEMPLHVGSVSGHNSLYPLPGAEASVEVKVVRLDTVLPAGQGVDVAKIDVEGAELDVLQGMSRVIADNPGILIVAEYGPSHLVRAAIAPEDWLSTFTAQGFKGYVIEEPSGDCVPIEQVDLSIVFSVNIAFIRATSPLRPRLEADMPALPSVVVIGAGGHAKVVVELIRAQGRYEVVGCTDRTPEQGDVVGAPVLGNDEILPDLYAQGVRHCFIALGDNALRRKVAARVTSLGFELVNAISPNAVVSPTARLGRGVAVMAGAVINAAAVVEDLAIINTRAVVDHDCRIAEAAHIAPGASLAGGVSIGPLAFVGAGATVIPDVSVGEATIVGAGATVTSNIGPHLVAFGVPAKPLKRHNYDQQPNHDESL